MSNGPSPTSFILRNGELIPAQEPSVLLGDAAIVQGHGLFETIKVYAGKPFALQEHLERMAEGCERLALTAPSFDAATESIEKLARANEMISAGNCRVRITITGGLANPVVFYETSDCPEHPETAKVMTGPFIRNERSLLAGIKTLSYGENAVAAQLTRQAGATEALWSNTQDELCEGTWSNVFVRNNGEWTTPPLASGCLPGVTREKILILARKIGIEIKETEINMVSLETVDAAFLTSSIREIQPIFSLDGRTLRSMEISEIASLKDAYSALVASSL